MGSNTGFQLGSGIADGTAMPVTTGYSGALLAGCWAEVTGDVVELPIQYSANHRHVAAAHNCVSELPTMANLLVTNYTQCGVTHRKISFVSAGSKRGLTSTLRREAAWSTDSVALFF